MNKLRLGLSLIVTAAITAFMAYTITPGLIRDWGMHGIQTAEAPSQLMDGRCRVYVFAVNFCSFKLQTEAALIDDTLLFVDFSPGNAGYDIQARADVADPSHVTTSLALTMFWDRFYTYVALMGLLLVGLIGGVAALFKPSTDAPG